MWEYILKDLNNKQASINSKLISTKERICMYFCASVFIIAAIVAFAIIIDSELKNSKSVSKNFLISLFVMILAAVSFAFIQNHIEKKKQTKKYREKELMNFKEIIEKKYQLNDPQKKKPFIYYLQKQIEQMNRSFFDRNAKVTAISMIIVFFTATMDTFSVFFQDGELFFAVWALFATLTFCGCIITYNFMRNSKSVRLSKCEKVCNLMQELLIFEESLEKKIIE